MKNEFLLVNVDLIPLQDESTKKFWADRNIPKFSDVRKVFHEQYNFQNINKEQKLEEDVVRMGLERLDTSVINIY